MDVQVLTKSDQTAHTALFDAMHRQRHEIFVAHLGWMDLWSPTGLEVDQFDDTHAVYLVAHEGDVVHGSLRILPAWRRSMLLECWPHAAPTLADDVDTSTWEWTRWCPGSASRPWQLLCARRALILEAVAFAQAQGVQRYVTLCETKFVEQLDALGWAPRPLGPSFAYAQGTAVGVGWTVRPNALLETAARLKSPRVRETVPALARAA